MKHATVVQPSQQDLELLVEGWIRDHDDEILEIIDISYEQYGGLYTATITYEERQDK